MEPQVLIRGNRVQVIVDNEIENLVHVETRESPAGDWCSSGRLWMAEWEQIEEVIRAGTVQEFVDYPGDFE